MLFLMKSNVPGIITIKYIQRIRTILLYDYQFVC